jgi:hypothetical protein
LAAFCFVFAMMVRWLMDVGGALLASARKAVHVSFFDVASMRAEPLLRTPTPTSESMTVQAGVRVPKITVPPGGTLRDVVTTSFAGPPPRGPKNSTPTYTVAVSVEVQETYVLSTPCSMAPATE